MFQIARHINNLVTRVTTTVFTAIAEEIAKSIYAAEESEEQNMEAENKNFTGMNEPEEKPTAESILAAAEAEAKVAAEREETTKTAIPAEETITPNSLANGMLQFLLDSGIVASACVTDETEKMFAKHIKEELDGITIGETPEILRDWEAAQNAVNDIKAGSSWKGKVYSSKTNECYDGKTYTQITAAFRAYDSPEESVADYYNLICGSSRYAGAVNNGNAESAITAIKNGGYATSPTYIKNVMNIINSYNLTQYDTWDGENQGPANKETHGYKVGDKVRVIDNITYNGVRFATYYDEYDVIQVNGDRVVIGIGNTVTAAVNAANIAKDEEIAEAPADAEVPTDIPTQEETENAHGFKVGQKVKVINAYDYYGNMFKCWYSKYDVIEVKNDRIVIGIGNTVTAAVNAANLAAA